MRSTDARKFRIGDYVVDTARYRVSHGDVTVAVEPKVFDLLVHLIRHRDRVLTREELFQSVWDGREVSEATLSNHVAKRAQGARRQRRAAADNSDRPRPWLPVRRAGHRGRGRRRQRRRRAAAHP